jgi:DNA-binding beta-propeller fold protein YncE
MKSIAWARVNAMTTVLILWLGIWGLLPNEVKAQSGQQAVKAPKYELDPFWPKPLPNRWGLGTVGSVCVDAQDHVFIVSRGVLYGKELGLMTVPPPVIEFDPDGNVVKAWGDRQLMANTQHGCFVDNEGNFWTAGNHDGIVQKYTHDGSKMLLQIGTRGKLDTADGTDSPDMYATNSSHVFLNRPTQVAVDPTNGDVYISDGYGNRRVVVFDREGHYLRQWGRQGTLEEVHAGVGGVFLSTVHCVVIGRDGLVYVCDWEGRRIEVFDKMGNFRRNYILVESEAAPLKGGGRPCWMGFSPDPAQTFMYVGDCGNEEIRIMDRETGKELSSFGRPGNQVGEFSSTHTLAVNSKGDIVVANTAGGRRVDMIRRVGR